MIVHYLLERYQQDHAPRVLLSSIAVQETACLEMKRLTRSLNRSMGRMLLTRTRLTTGPGQEHHV